MQWHPYGCCGAALGPIHLGHNGGDEVGKRLRNVNKRKLRAIDYLRSVRKT